MKRSLALESKGRCFHMETIATWFSVACAVASIATVLINLWLNR